MTANPIRIDRRQGLWLGVCQGVADWSGVPVGLVRTLLLLVTIFSLGLPAVIAYALIGYLGQPTR
jgi:phage shock protein PspC (stress-responsive transcriptional regulator)